MSKHGGVWVDVAAGVFIAAAIFGCTSLMLLKLADIACGPAAHAAPSPVVGHPALLTSRVDLSETSWAGSTQTRGAIK